MVLLLLVTLHFLYVSRTHLPPLTQMFLGYRLLSVLLEDWLCLTTRVDRISEFNK